MAMMFKNTVTQSLRTKCKITLIRATWICLYFYSIYHQLLISFFTSPQKKRLIEAIETHSKIIELE